MGTLKTVAGCWKSGRNRGGTVSPICRGNGASAFLSAVVVVLRSVSLSRSRPGPGRRIAAGSLPSVTAERRMAPRHGYRDTDGHHRRDRLCHPRRYSTGRVCGGRGSAGATARARRRKRRSAERRRRPCRRGAGANAGARYFVIVVVVVGVWATAEGACASAWAVGCNVACGATQLPVDCLRRWRGLLHDGLRPGTLACTVG